MGGFCSQISKPIEPFANYVEVQEEGSILMAKYIENVNSTNNYLSQAQTFIQPKLPIKQDLPKVSQCEDTSDQDSFLNLLTSTAPLNSQIQSSNKPAGKKVISRQRSEFEHKCHEFDEAFLNFRTKKESLLKKNSSQLSYHSEQNNLSEFQLQRPRVNSVQDVSLKGILKKRKKLKKEDDQKQNKKVCFVGITDNDHNPAYKKEIAKFYQKKKKSPKPTKCQPHQEENLEKYKIKSPGMRASRYNSKQNVFQPVRTQSPNMPIRKSQSPNDVILRRVSNQSLNI